MGLLARKSQFHHNWLIGALFADLNITEDDDKLELEMAGLHTSDAEDSDEEDEADALTAAID